MEGEGGLKEEPCISTSASAELFGHPAPPALLLYLGLWLVNQ